MKVGIFMYDDDFNRITVSKGAIIVNELNGLPCRKNTYVPKGNWQKSDDLDYGLNKSNYLLNVSVNKLSNSLIGQLKKMDFQKCNTYRDIHFIQESSEYKNCTFSIIKHLSKFNEDGIRMTEHKLYFSNQSLKNNTFNAREKKYLGMHLDSYEGQRLSTRSISRNRICINLGQESRFLLFYRTPIIEMARKNLNTSDNQSINEIYRKYMSTHSDDLIYRLEVKPYEYYIAPTESIIHDGSNHPSNSPDITLVFRGRFFYKKSGILDRINNLLKL